MSNYFSKNLKYLRVIKNVSQNKLASLANVSASTINRWEAEEMSPSLDNVNDVARALNVSVADLLGKDMKSDENFDEYALLFSKFKELSNEDKELITNIIETRKKQIDKELEENG